MYICAINCNQTQTAFKGINVGKGLNQGIDVIKKVLPKANNLTDSFNSTKVVTMVLNGPKEIAESKKIVHTFSTTAAGIAAAMAQEPGADELALFANDLAMTRIISKIYKQTWGDSILKEVLTGLLANHVGTKLFSKFVTWIPGAGNAINAGVAAGTTEAVGHAFIKYCEKATKI